MRYAYDNFKIQGDEKTHQRVIKCLNKFLKGEEEEKQIINHAKIK